MRTFRTWVAAACVAIVVLALAPGSAHATAAAPPTSPYTAMVRHTAKFPDSVGYGSGVQVSWQAGTASVGESLQFAYHPSSATFARVIVRMPVGGQLAAGATYPVGPPTAVLVFTSDSSIPPTTNCLISGGTVTVHDLARDASSAIVEAGISIVLTDSCGGTTIELRDNSTTGWSSWDSTVPVLEQMSVLFPATPQTATVTGTGPDPVTLGAISVANTTGTDPVDQVFSLGTGGSCATGTTLAFGQSCTIVVDRKITHWGFYQGTLSIVDSSGRTRLVPLQVTETAKANGGFVGHLPDRILDTRIGVGAGGPLGPGGVIVLPALAHSGGWTSKDITAVEFNVTVTNAAADSYLTLYPDDASRPTVSNLNFTRGWTGANAVTVKVGADGGVAIYNHAGTVDVIVDAIGWYFNDQGTAYPAAGQYHPHAPVRVADSRISVGQVPAHRSIAVAMDYGTAVNQHVSALALNVTAVGAHGSGYLDIYPPNSVGVGSHSTVNFTPGTVVANKAIVGTAVCAPYFTLPCTSVPTIYAYNGSDSGVDVVVDVFGYYDDGAVLNGLAFHPITPVRIIDSRQGAPLTTNSSTVIPVPAAIPGTRAIVANLTGIAPTTATYLTAWPGTTARPTVSNLNLNAGQILPNAIQVGLDDGERFSLYNHAGTVNYVVDVGGLYFGQPTGDSPPVPLPPKIV